MDISANTVIINGVEYVEKSSVINISVVKDGMRYVMVRAHEAGVFAGYLENKIGSEVVLRNARRIWYWDGAASLSQLATDGTSKPENCKFPCEVSRVQLLNVIEIIDITAKAEKSIKEVDVWKQ